MENTEENRRAYRELLVTTPGLGQFVSGFLVFEETLTHKAADGTSLVDIAKKAGMIVGIKVDKGTVPIPGTDGETDTQGHTDLCVVVVAHAAARPRFVSTHALTPPPHFFLRTAVARDVPSTTSRAPALQSGARSSRSAAAAARRTLQSRATATASLATQPSVK